MKKLKEFFKRIITIIKQRKMDELIILKAQALDAILAKESIESQISDLQSKLPAIANQVDDLKAKVQNYMAPVIGASAETDIA